MSRTYRLAAICVLLLAALGLVVLTTSPIALAQPRPMPPPDKGDVVLIACNGSGSFAVTAFQGSPGTPARKSVSCAESLSLLMKDGFLLRDIGQNIADKTGLVVYTLVR